MMRENQQRGTGVGTVSEQVVEPNLIQIAGQKSQRLSVQQKTYYDTQRVASYFALEAFLAVYSLSNEVFARPKDLNLNGALIVLTKVVACDRCFENYSAFERFLIKNK